MYMQAWKFLNDMSAAVSPDLQQKGPFRRIFSDGTQFMAREMFGQSIIEIYVPQGVGKEVTAEEELKKIIEKMPWIAFQLIDNETEEVITPSNFNVPDTNISTIEVEVKDRTFVFYDFSGENSDAYPYFDLRKCSDDRTWLNIVPYFFNYDLEIPYVPQMGCYDLFEMFLRRTGNTFTYFETHFLINDFFKNIVGTYSYKGLYSYCKEDEFWYVFFAYLFSEDNVDPNGYNLRLSNLENTEYNDLMYAPTAINEDDLKYNEYFYEKENVNYEENEEKDYSAQDYKEMAVYNHQKYIVYLSKPVYIQITLNGYNVTKQVACYLIDSNNNIVSSKWSDQNGIVQFSDIQDKYIGIGCANYNNDRLFEYYQEVAEEKSDFILSCGIDERESSRELDQSGVSINPFSQIRNVKTLANETPYEPPDYAEDYKYLSNVSMKQHEQKITNLNTKNVIIDGEEKSVYICNFDELVVTQWLYYTTSWESICVSGIRLDVLAETGFGLFPKGCGDFPQLTDYHLMPKHYYSDFTLNETYWTAPYAYYVEYICEATSTNTDLLKAIAISDGKGQNIQNLSSTFTIDLSWTAEILEEKCIPLVGGGYECGTPNSEYNWIVFGDSLGVCQQVHFKMIETPPERF